MASRRVVVTGAASYIASQLLPAFRERYDLVLLDKKREDAQGNAVSDVVEADLADRDLDRYRRHFRGADAVVHLAYHRPLDRPGMSAFQHSYYDERVNVDLAYHVYQLAHDEGVRRVVVASSNHAADWWEHPLRARTIEMIGPESPRPLSDNYYGWAKEVYEHLGFLFATGTQGRKLGVVAVRIGAPREIELAKFRDDPVGYKRDLGAYISQRDLQQLFVKSIEAPNIDNAHGIPFQVFYGVSDNARAFWSIENARQVIGYQPQDDSEIRYAGDIASFLARPDARPGRL